MSGYVRPRMQPAARLCHPPDHPIRPLLASISDLILHPPIQPPAIPHSNCTVYMLRSPAALPKPRASFPVSGISSLNRISTANRTTAVPSTRPRSATPATHYTPSRLPTPSAIQPGQLLQRSSRRRSSTIVEESNTRMKPVVASVPRPGRRKSSDAASSDLPLAQSKRRGILPASETSTLARVRSRTSPPRSVFAAEIYPTPPSSVGTPASRRTTYQSTAPTVLDLRPDATPIRMLPLSKEPRAQATLSTEHNNPYPPDTNPPSRALPSATLPLKIRRRTQTSSTRAVRWRPRAPSPEILFLMDDVASFQDEWTQLFSDVVFEQAWMAFLDLHADEREKYEVHDEGMTHTVQAPRRPSVSSSRAVSLRLRPTLGVDMDEEKILRRKSPVVDIFSMLSRDARTAGRSSRLSSPPRIPLPDVPSGPSRMRWSNDSIVSSLGTVSVRSSPDVGGISTFSTPPRDSNATLLSDRLSTSSTAGMSDSREVLDGNDSNTSLCSIGSIYTEITSSPPTDRALRRNAMHPAYLPAELLQSLPLPIDEASPLGLVNVPGPHGYLHKVTAQDVVISLGYSTDQAFALTDSRLALSTPSSPGKSAGSTTLAPPIGGSLRGTGNTGLRFRKVTASLANPRTPLENPRRPPLRSVSLQPQQSPVRAGSLRGIHKLFDRRASDLSSHGVSLHTGRRYSGSSESLKSRISGPVVSVAGIIVTGSDSMIDLRDLSLEEEDGSVYDESSEE